MMFPFLLLSRVCLSFGLRGRPRVACVSKARAALCFSGGLLATESSGSFGRLYASERTSSYRGAPASRKCGSGLGAVFWEPLRLLEVSLDASTTCAGAATRREALDEPVEQTAAAAHNCPHQRAIAAARVIQPRSSAPDSRLRCSREAAAKGVLAPRNTRTPKPTAPQ